MPYQLFCELPTSAGGTRVVDVHAGDTIGHLTGRLAQELGVPNDRLACYRPDGSGAALPWDLGLSEASADGYRSLRVSWLLAGGKTHGRIGNAGKVRSQTPHVEKAGDRPKDKTGRARKRRLCSRRFPGAEMAPPSAGEDRQ